MTPTDLLRDLVSRPSINPMGRAVEGPRYYEHAVTARIEDFLRPLGVPHQRQIIAPLRDNIVAVYQPPQPTGTLVFEVHQDTVPVEGMVIDPFAAEVRDGKLYGRGACDVKGGMASMLTAFARLCLEKPAKCARVVMACTVDEEFTFLGVQRLVKDDLTGGVPGPVAAVVAEPTGLDIVDAHKGVARWAITTSGRACHSSRPDKGINAVYRMGRLLPHIEDYAAHLASQTAHSRLGPRTISLGTIAGGASVNVVPDGCRIDIDRRLLPGEVPTEAPMQLDAWLRERVPSVPFDTGKPYLFCPALPNDGAAAITAALGSAIDAVRGKHAVHAVPYGTDASSFALAGVPAVVFGPGDIDQAHTCDEWIEVAQLDAAAEILYRLALSWGR